LASKSIVTPQRFQCGKADLSAERSMKFDEERCSFGSSGAEFRVLFSLNWQFQNKVLCSFNKLCGLLISARTTGVCARVTSAKVCSWVCRANASTLKRVADATVYLIHNFFLKRMYKLQGSSFFVNKNTYFCLSTNYQSQFLSFIKKYPSTILRPRLCTACSVSRSQKYLQSGSSETKNSKMILKYIKNYNLYQT